MHNYVIHRLPRTALIGLLVSVIAAQAAFSQESGQDSNRAFQRYEIEKIDPWGPFVLNLLLNFGIGSFVQGDTTGGLIVAGGQVIGNWAGRRGPRERARD